MAVNPAGRERDMVGVRWWRALLLWLDSRGLLRIQRRDVRTPRTEPEPPKRRTVFGKPEEWRAFDARHPAWESSAARLRAALERAFLRDVPVDEKGLHFIFALGRIAVEDFAEILLLSGNGYGIGALKILRGMYERVVTALYLSKHVDETDGLLKYDYVHRRKLLNHARNAGIDLSAHAQQVAEIEREYQQIKDDYKEVVCRECGTTKTQSSWTQRDLKTMADEVGLGNAYGLMYF